MKHKKGEMSLAKIAAMIAGAIFIGILIFGIYYLLTSLTKT